MIMKLVRKRRAVSPVIAVILLIGLTVLAGAVVSFVVLPMLNPQLTQSKVVVTQASGDTAYMDGNNLVIEITVQNKYTSAIELTTAELEYDLLNVNNTAGEHFTEIHRSATNIGETIDSGNSRTIVITITNVHRPDETYDHGSVRGGEYDMRIDNGDGITFTFTSGDDQVEVELTGEDITDSF